MTPRSLSVLIAGFPYGGNGAISNQIPEVGDYIANILGEMRADPRIERVVRKNISDTPITMTRNAMCKAALEMGIDLILMIDSDNAPDYLVGKDEYAKPFWQTSFDYLYKHYDRGPMIIGAPYCGPPPEECVYVFEWTKHAENIAEARQSIGMFTRNAAAIKKGIEPVAAIATGVILIDTRILRDTDPKERFNYYLGQGFSRAEAREKMTGWFYYEWEDEYCSQKASTEDVTFTRDMSLFGIHKYGFNPVHCNWDAWAVHYKPHRVLKPTILGVDQLADTLIRAARMNIPSNARMENVDFTQGLLAPGTGLSTAPGTHGRPGPGADRKAGGGDDPDGESLGNPVLRNGPDDGGAGGYAVASNWTFVPEGAAYRLDSTNPSGLSTPDEPAGSENGSGTGGHPEGVAGLVGGVSTEPLPCDRTGGIPTWQVPASY